MDKKSFTISVYTENRIGVLNRISTIFLRRKINIESFTTSESEINGVFRFVLVVLTTEIQVKRIIGQIEKQIEVIKAYYHTDEETIHIECAMFKIRTELLFKERWIQNIIKKSNAVIMTVSEDFFVIAKTGRRHETEALYKDLKPYGIMQFVRTGRISVSKSQMNISELLKAFN